MESLPFPTPVLLSLAIAAFVGVLELVGWFILCPRYSRLLPFRKEVPADLPLPTGEVLNRDERGRGEYTVWRWHAGHRALIFRRRLEPGRKPYCIGRLQLDDQGGWSLSWAPFPFFAWPAAAAAWFILLIGLGWAHSPGGGVMMTVASALFVLVIVANLYLSRRAFDRIVWPELQEQVRDLLA